MGGEEESKDVVEDGLADLRVVHLAETSGGAVVGSEDSERERWKPAVQCAVPISQDGPVERQFYRIVLI